MKHQVKVIMTANDKQQQNRPYLYNFPNKRLARPVSQKNGRVCLQKD